MVYNGKPYQNSWFEGFSPYFWFNTHLVQPQVVTDSKPTNLIYNPPTWSQNSSQLFAWWKYPFLRVWGKIAGGKTTTTTTTKKKKRSTSFQQPTTLRSWFRTLRFGWAKMPLKSPLKWSKLRLESFNKAIIFGREKRKQYQKQTGNQPEKRLPWTRNVYKVAPWPWFNGVSVSWCFLNPK